MSTYEELDKAISPLMEESIKRTNALKKTHRLVAILPRGGLWWVPKNEDHMDNAMRCTGWAAECKGPDG